MHYSPSAQHPLEGWLVLQVAELCNGEEIQALRGTSRTIRATLDKYEVSTAMNNLARRDYPVPPRDRILCSAFPERPVIRLASYAAINELEGRRRKITYLVQDSMYLRYGYRRCSITERDPERLATVIDSLERAMWICTDLADIEASGREPAPYAHPLAGKLDCSHQPKRDAAEGRPTNSFYSTESVIFDVVMLQGHRTPHIHLDGTSHGLDTDDDASTQRPAGSLPSNLIRQAQLEAITELSTEDLSAMFILSALATRGFEEYMGKNRMKTYPRDVVREWCVSVAENAYRHGVFFLYPQALRGQPSELSSSASTHDNQPYPGLQVPRSAMTVVNQKSHKKPTWNRRNPCCIACSRRMAGHAAAMMCQVVEEMHRWENGQDDMLPSLSMTIRSLLRRRFKCETDDVHDNASLVVRGLDPVATMDM